MARRRSLLGTIIKISNDIERQNKRNQKEQEKAEREHERMVRQAQRDQEREDNEWRKRRDAAIKLKLKDDKLLAKRQEKEHAQYVKEIKLSLESYTVSHFGLGNKKPRAYTTITDLSVAKDIAKLKKDKADPFLAKFGNIKFDEIVFSGKFNSVLGYDGLLEFKKNLDELKISFDEFKEESTAFKNVLDFAFRSGVYLAEDATDSNSTSWLTAYRFILMNCDLEDDCIYGITKIRELVNSFEIDKKDLDLCSEKNKKALLEYLADFKENLPSDFKKFILSKNQNRLVG